MTEREPPLGAEDQDPEAGTSERLSPLSVPYRIAERGVSLVITVAVFLFSGASMLGGVGGALVGGALLATVLGLLVGYEVAYYRRYEYELTADTLDIRSGVISRRNREIPLERIQNVDISRNVVQRVLDIAAVNLETAGGDETEAAIRYLDFEAARRLQGDIARLKRERRGTTATAPEEETLFSLSAHELALVGALSFDLRVPGALAFLLSGSLPAVAPMLPGDVGTAGIVVGGGAVIAAIVLFSWLAGATVAVLNYYGFTLSRVDDELQYGRGLLRRYDGSIPLEKVQVLTVSDNPLKRWFGYATLTIETAGYAPGRGASGGSEAAVPLASEPRVYGLAREIEPFGEPRFERPPRRVRRRYVVRYLLVLGSVVSVLWGVDAVLPHAIPWYLPGVFLPVVPVLAHYTWKHRGYWLGEDHLVTRNGVFARETKVVPYYRIQTIIDSRGLFQRRWGLATVTADTAGSSSLTGQDAAAVDIDAGVADELRETLGDRLDAALARRRNDDGRDARGDSEDGGDASGARAESRGRVADAGGADDAADAGGRSTDEADGRTDQERTDGPQAGPTRAEDRQNEADEG